MELFDVIDSKGNPTGQIVSREKAHAEGIPHRTVHIWIIREKEGRVQILLQKRSQNKDSFPGKFDTSSAGHIQAGDEPLESAIRELKEESGTVQYRNNCILPEPSQYLLQKNSTEKCSGTKRLHLFIFSTNL